MKKHLILLAALHFALSFPLLSQEKYFIQFTDKYNSPYSIDRPEEFLGPQSVSRRARQGIAITNTDLPVNPNYITSISEFGVTVLYPLRWFNGAVVEAPTDPPLANGTIDSIALLPWVESVELVFCSTTKAEQMPPAVVYPYVWTKSTQHNYYSYGAGAQQVEMLNGNILHNKGYRGKGITIALLDAGYLHTDTLSGFKPLYNEQRLLGTYDLVDPTSDIYQEHGHGTIVLSAMATYLPGEMVGTAPEASYILIRTEDANSEQIIEEYNWAAGAELADSLGADIINSSLGYYLYDVPEQSHSYADINGVTTPSTRAANFAANVGMLVVTSAGNEGGTSWQHIISPADGISCIAIGAVDKDSIIVPFSSIGPTADGRIKPELVAMGLSTSVQGTNGSIGTANGTSLSAPIISGLAACLWQANPDLTASEIRDRLILSGSQALEPNNQIGYGIPNFAKALTGESTAKAQQAESLNLFPNPACNSVSIVVPNGFGSKSHLNLYATNGSLIQNQEVSTLSPIVTMQFPTHLPTGLYVVTLQNGNKHRTGRFIKKNEP